MVHDLLWKQLGLLVRDSLGRYLVMHQTVSEFLLTREQENRRKIRRYHRARSLLAALCACLVFAASAFTYKAFIAPQPYKEAYADNVMSRIGAANNLKILTMHEDIFNTMHKI